jgi:hypothetical protein
MGRCVVTLKLGLRLALCGLIGCACACSQILAIEDAHVDSTLEDDGSDAGSSGASSSGGDVMPQGSAGGQGHEGHSSPMPTAGSSGSSGSSPIETGAGGAPPEPTLCERYCDQMIANCTGKYEQYRSFDQCVAVCKRLPEGEPEDDEVNTVSCRLRQAEFAASEPFVYCKSAGPLGAGRCGSNCISYCSIMQATCTAESTAGNLELSYFATNQECVEACGALPSDQGPQQYSSSATAEPSSFIGNHVYCRTYHVAAALEQNTPDEHCPHAMGGDPCHAP